MRARVFLAVFIAVLLAPGVARAKGPDLATIDGAGMVAPISIAGAEGSDDDLGTLVELAGLLPAAFGQTPDPMLAAAPKEDLGPKLVITWRIPDGGPAPRSVQQELYLYAEGGPVTYTAPDQPFMGGDRTAGGWFRTPISLEAGWQAFGLPARTTLEAAARPETAPPDPTSGPEEGWLLWAGVVAITAAALLALGVTASRVTSGRRVRIGST